MTGENTTIKLEYKIHEGDFTRAGEASSNIKKMLTQLGVDSRIIRRAAVVIYEAEMNIVIHSHGGTIIAIMSAKDISLYAKDKGPGIKDIKLAMEEGYSTASNSVRELGFGAGMGLPNMKRFSDIFEIKSTEGGETEVLMRIFINEGNDY